MATGERAPLVEPELDREKLKALVHYICWQCDDPKTLGGTKLNKVLWYSDMSSYVRRNQPITGEKYVKRQFGPVAYHLLPILDELASEGRVIKRRVGYRGRPKDEFFALKEPPLDQFDAEEINLINRWIEYVCRQNTAESISHETHDIIWELAELGEEIPYYTVWASELGEVTPEDLQWASSEPVDAGQPIA